MKVTHFPLTGKQFWWAIIITGTTAGVLFVIHLAMENISALLFLIILGYVAVPIVFMDDYRERDNMIFKLRGRGFAWKSTKRHTPYEVDDVRRRVPLW